MNEKLFQYIWQFGYFNRSSLQTTSGEAIQILHPGKFNTQQGPDFLHAKIKINDTVWAGSVEVHLRSSDWAQHGHDNDPNYNNVILHVVYMDDKPSHMPIPVLSLHDRIPAGLLERYDMLMHAQAFIPCENLIHTVPDIIVNTWKESVMVERLMCKTEVIAQHARETQYHWETVFWWLIARNFGMKTNADVFEAIAKSISIQILAKHRNQLQQLEALLLGQAGLLEEEFKDAYPLMLQKEYRFLKKKYKLIPIHIPVHFLRMRPGNFPTVRLAQLAALIQSSVHLFSKIVEEENLLTVRKCFQVSANDFWSYHYTLQDASAYKVKSVGNTMINHIIINTVVPALFAYADFHTNDTLKAKAIRWLQETPPEKNNITRGFEALGILNNDAMQSQGLLELKTMYCDARKCLDCAIGNHLIKKEV